MHLQNAIRNLCEQLSATLTLLSDDQYSSSLEILSGASIGQHLRHITDMFECLQQGLGNGTVNYEARQRDRKVETDKVWAMHILGMVSDGLQLQNFPLLLFAGFNENSDDQIELQTNYYRELAYNLEHAIHHLAIIKIGIRALIAIELPADFGVASSTIKFRAACAQ